MFRIRLQPCNLSCSSRKSYNIVSIDSRRKLSSHKCNKLGYYTIYSNGKKTLWINQNRFLKTLFEGGQPTKSVSKLLAPILKNL